MHTEIFTTLLVFLASANREIVKSILGFIKLAIHTLPSEIIRPHLPALVPALLGWSHDHKNHFKAKVRHIFERMLRKFGWDEVYGCVDGQEASKVLVNIRKRKERAKRKKAAREDENEPPGTKTEPAGDAFEDVLYGSESEVDDSEDDEEQAPQARGRSTVPKKGVDHGGVRLRVDDDEPIDLLQGVASRITDGRSSRRRKPGQDAAQFKMDEDTGKMIIDDAESDDDEQQHQQMARSDLAGTAYRDSLTSIDGFTRGPNGRVKFNKDTKKRRRADEDIEGDVEMADADAAAKKKIKRKQEARLGHEFKAKKAGGDVKKGGLDPYAYLSLSQAAKRNGRGGRDRIGIAKR